MWGFAHLGNTVVVDTNGERKDGTTSHSIPSCKRLPGALETFAGTVPIWVVSLVGRTGRDGGACGSVAGLAGLVGWADAGHGCCVSSVLV
jgi:hypothetical protein